MAHLLVDCGRCKAYPGACSDCVVSVLLGAPQQPESLELDDDERDALGVMADSGLLPPLRLVLPIKGGDDPEARMAM